MPKGKRESECVGAWVCAEKARSEGDGVPAAPKEKGKARSECVRECVCGCVRKSAKRLSAFQHFSFSAFLFSFSVFSISAFLFSISLQLFSTDHLTISTVPVEYIGSIRTSSIPSACAPITL